MGEAEGGIKQIDPKFAMDLLARFVSSNIGFGGNLNVKEEIFEVELTLGLSTNGKFGDDPSCKKRKCSSFEPELMKPVKVEEESTVSVFPAMGAMEMISSVPVETEEARRKRKEAQSIRRMEARHKRMARRMNLRPVKKCVSPPLPSFPKKELNKCIDEEKRSPTNTQTSLPDQSDYESEVNNPVTSNENQSKEAKVMMQKLMLGMPCVTTKGVAKVMMQKLMLGMPCVTTKGVGTKCKTVRGLLYPCKKGEEVKIVCICHGSFHSPAQFVKHAGGEDVDNPLKHIVVNPCSFS